MTIDEFLTRHARTPRPKGQRVGQWMFNDMAKVRPDVTESLRGTAADCFYEDNLIFLFVHEAADRW